MVLGAHVAHGPVVVLALGLGEGDLAGVAVPQLDPGLQDLPGSGGGLVEKKPSHHHTITRSLLTMDLCDGIIGKITNNLMILEFCDDFDII